MSPISDNSTQTGADTIATDDVTTLNGAASTGVKVQRVKVGYGDDSSHRDASAAFPLPTVQTGALPAGTNSIGAVTLGAALPAGSNAIGTVAVNAAIPAGSNAIGTVALNAALPAGANQIGTIGELRASTLAVTATAALSAAATATLPAAGAGVSHYITSISITAYSAAARTGSATPWVVTSTNLPGSPAWTFSTAGAIGATETQTFFPTTPLKSSAANTATTIVGPAATSVIWRISVAYFTAA